MHQALILFETYTNATEDFVEAAVTASNLVGSREECAETRKHAEETYANSRSAFFALMEPRREHDCLAMFRDEARQLEQQQD
jgi:type II secretory pathway component PulJ